MTGLANFKGSLFRESRRACPRSEAWWAIVQSHSSHCPSKDVASSWVDVRGGWMNLCYVKGQAWACIPGSGGGNEVWWSWLNTGSHSVFNFYFSWFYLNISRTFYQFLDSGWTGAELGFLWTVLKAIMHSILGPTSLSLGWVYCSVQSVGPIKGVCSGVTGWEWGEDGRSYRWA